MSEQSFLAKNGLRSGILGSSSALAIAAPVATGDYDVTASTYASRIGLYFDRTAATEHVGLVVMGAVVARFQQTIGFIDVALTIAGKTTTAATTVSAAGLNIPHGTAPTSPVNGDFWSTTAGFFGRVNGTTVGPFGSSSVPGGATTQVQYNNAGAFGGDAGFTYDGAGSTTLTKAGSASYIGINTTLGVSGGAMFIARADDGSTIAVSGNRIGSFAMSARATPAVLVSSAGIMGFATETWSATAAGSELRLETTNNGSLVRNPRVTIGNGVLTSTVEIVTPASTTTLAGLNIPHGTAPTSPVNGDFWSTTAGFFGRVNSVTVGPFGAAGSGTPGGANTNIQYNNSGAFGGDAGLSYDNTNFIVTLKGTGTPSVLPDLKYQAVHTTNTYIQSNMQNLSNGAAASADWIVTSDTGTDTTNFVDMGINGSGWATGSWTVNGANDAYLYSGTTGLAIGTGGTAKEIRIFTGGTLSANIRMTVFDASITTTVPLRPFDGSQSLPAYAFITEPDCGFYVIGGNNIGLSTNATLRWDVSATAITSTLIGIFPASTTTAASIRLPHGTAPSAPVNGDLWSDTTGFFGRVNGGTVGFATGTGAANRVTYWSSTTLLTSSANLTFDGNNFVHSGTGNFTTGTGPVGINGLTTFTEPVSTTGSPTGILFTGAAHTTLTASAEVIDVNFNLARIVQRNTGALATQRAFVIQAPTYSFVAASTITTAATFAITAAPTAGTNATLTTPLALWVQAGNVLFAGSQTVSGSLTVTTNETVGGTLGVTGTSTLRTVLLNTSTTANFTITQGAASSGASTLMVITGAAHTAQTASTEQIDINYALNRTVQHATGALATQRAFVIQAPTYSFVAASTLTSAATFAVTGAPVAGTNATLTDSYSIWVQAGLLGTAASTTTVSGFRLPHGTAPTTPKDGDMWTTTAGVFARINGATVGPFAAGLSGSGAANQITYFTGTSTVSSEAAFGYNPATNTMTVDTGSFGLGAIATPGVTFQGASDMGLYYVSAGIVGLAMAGSRAITFNSDATSLAINSAWGTATTGNFSINSVLSFVYDTASLYTATGGTIVAPAYTFYPAALAGSGMYASNISAGSDLVGLAMGSSRAVTFSADATSLAINSAWSGATTGSFSVNGTLAFTYTATALYPASGGSISSPTYAFYPAALVGAGMYATNLAAGDDLIGLAMGSSRAVTFNSDATSLAVKANWSGATTINYTVNATLACLMNTNQIQSNFGTVGAPGWSFIGDSDTGFRRSASGTVIFVSDGVDVITFGAGGILTPVLFADGSASAPSVAFSSDTNTGMYRVSSDVIGWTVGGTEGMRLTTTALELNSLVNGISINKTTNNDIVFSAINGSSGSSAASALSLSSDAVVILLRACSTTYGSSTGGISMSSKSFLGSNGPTVIGSTNGSDVYFVSNASQYAGKYNNSGVWDFGVTGTAAAPTLTFVADSDTGIYRSAANILGLAAGGTAALLVSATELTSAVNLKLTVAGNGLYVKEGTNATMGVATLAAGTVTVSTTKVTANSRIFLSVQSLGTVAVATPIAVTARTAGTSFTITSSAVTDTSVISWIICEPA